MNLQHILFLSFSTLILISAGFVAFRPRPVESAMWLILNFFLTAALYVVLGSHFVAAVQVLVYAGAIMVLFVFVILLLNLDPRELGTEASVSWASISLIAAFLTFILLSLYVSTPELMKSFPPIPENSQFGGVEHISRLLLTDYMWGFELAGFILLLAVIGVGMLAYRKQTSSKLGAKL